MWECDRACKGGGGSPLRAEHVRVQGWQACLGVTVSPSTRVCKAHTHTGVTLTCPLHTHARDTHRCAPCTPADTRTCPVHTHSPSNTPCTLACHTHACPASLAPPSLALPPSLTRPLHTRSSLAPHPLHTQVCPLHTHALPHALTRPSPDTLSCHTLSPFPCTPPSHLHTHEPHPPTSLAHSLTSPCTLPSPLHTQM